MGIVSAVVGQAADVSVNAFALHCLFYLKPPFVKVVLITKHKLDQHSCTDLHLRRALHCHGNRRCGVPIRAVWPTE